MNIPAEPDEQAVPPTEEPREEPLPADEAEIMPVVETEADVMPVFDAEAEIMPVADAEAELEMEADLENEYEDEDENDDDDDDDDGDELEETAVSPAEPLATLSAAEEPAAEQSEPEAETEPDDLPVTRLTLGAFGFAADDDDEEAAPRPVRIRKQRRQPLRTPRKNQPTLQQVTDRFAACGRCSYFWAGYRVLFGLAEQETAVAHSKSGWLELNWDERMPELVVKSYGVRLDTGHYHYEGCCQECRRHFIYQASDKEDEADAFRIEVTPYMAK